MSDSNNTVPAGFRVIPGYPRYAIDEYGTILSICSPSGRGKDRHWENASTVTHVIRPKGYHVISLCGANGDKRIRTVHVLVLEAFVGPCPVGHQCRHIDGNPANNHISNLAWGTSLENNRDKILHGTSNQGECSSKAKLTNEDVIEIRKRRANGEPIKTIAKDFPLKKNSIYNIVNRLTWNHV